jgi:hypothetical protein
MDKMDKVVHFEIPADDVGRAKKFYGTIFGWQIEDMPMAGRVNYTIVRTVDVDNKMMPKEAGAINGGIMERTKHVKSPVVTIDVVSIDDYLAEIEDAGGKIVMPKKEIPDMGYYAYFSDTEGNVMGLWEIIKK